jgi:hypothetical protein
MVALYGITKGGMWWSFWKDIMSFSMFFVKEVRVETDFGEVLYICRDW